MRSESLWLIVGAKFMYLFFILYISVLAFEAEWMISIKEFEDWKRSIIKEEFGSKQEETWIPWDLYKQASWRSNTEFKYTMNEMTNEQTIATSFPRDVCLRLLLIVCLTLTETISVLCIMREIGIDIQNYHQNSDLLFRPLSFKICTNVMD